MKTFYITTLGCKVNQYESQQIRQFIEHLGLIFVNIDQLPDLAVVNTCCVTHVASAKSRQQIRKIKKLSPKTLIVMAGCLPVSKGTEHLSLPDNIVTVPDKSLLPQYLKDIIDGNQGPDIHSANSSDYSRAQKSPKIKQKTNIIEGNNVKFGPLKSFQNQTRAFLKIQDGCDGFCSYCIIPKIRSNVCNKNVKTVIKEAADLVKAGHKEIVLTGIFLGAYGQTTVRRKHWDPDRQQIFADLVDNLAKVDGLERLRLSSLEPGDVTDKLLDVFCKNGNIMPHFHLPLQSGSEKILKKMCRQYTLSEFRKIISKINLCLDRPAVTTDIIVGFPGESDQDFEQTMDFAEQMGFSKIHVFTYSRRKGTSAEKMQPKVKPAVAQYRSKILRNLDARLQSDFRRKFVGKLVSAVIESENPVRGRTKRYFEVRGSDLDSPHIIDGWLLEGFLKL